MDEGNSILSLLAADNNFERIFSKLNLPAALISEKYELLWSAPSFPLTEADIASPIPSDKPAVRKINSDLTLSYIPIIFKGKTEGFLVAAGKEDAESPDELKRIKHDLNNIITLILNVISMQAMGEGAKAGIDVAGSFLSGVFGGKHSPAADTAPLINNIITAYSTGLIAINSNIAPRLLPVRMSEDNFIRVITNLITNAIEALGEKGAITITADNSSLKNKNSVILKVADNGPGISPDALPNIFNPGFSTKQRGSGIGLNIVKEIIESAGGTIDVKSVSGKGTEFIISLPAAENLKRRIALVEDEPFLNEVLTSQLSADYDVLSYADAETFLEDFGEKQPELIIIDKKLPGMQGTECIKEIRKQNSRVKIIFASGTDIDGLKSRQQARINMLIKKPYNFDELSSGIEELLG